MSQLSIALLALVALASFSLSADIDARSASASPSTSGPGTASSTAVSPTRLSSASRSATTRCSRTVASTTIRAWASGSRRHGRTVRSSRDTSNIREFFHAAVGRGMVLSCNCLVRLIRVEYVQIASLGASSVLSRHKGDGYDSTYLWLSAYVNRRCSRATRVKRDGDDANLNSRR